jgi:hypothetical protein
LFFFLTVFVDARAQLAGLDRLKRAHRGCGGQGGRPWA